MPSFKDFLAASVEAAFDEWTPTPENINALPERLRKYIHDLETRCDPAGETQARVLAEDTARWAYEKGWQEGGEAMRKAIIEEVT